jgi:hypothetical protein
VQFCISSKPVRCSKSWTLYWAPKWLFSSSTPVFRRIEWIGTLSGLQGRHYFPQKSKTDWGKTGLSYEGTAQIHFINVNGGTQDTGSSTADSVDIVSVSSITWAFLFRKMKLIKSFLISAVSQGRFRNLADFSVEKELVSSIDFSDVSKDFAVVKSWNVKF